MTAPLSLLNAALKGRECSAQRREADWTFNFGHGFNIAASVPWRIVTAQGIAHGVDDDGQQFGLSKPVDGEARTNALLKGRVVIGAELDEHTADLRISFDDELRLDLFNNSSGYEGWQASFPGEGTIVALGGGSVATYPD